MGVFPGQMRICVRNAATRYARKMYSNVTNAELLYHYVTNSIEKRERRGMRLSFEVGIPV